MTERDDAIVAIHATQEAAETGIRAVAEAGLDMKRFSIIGKGYHTEKKVIGFYGSGDRVRFSGSRVLSKAFLALPDVHACPVLHRAPRRA